MRAGGGHPCLLSPFTLCALQGILRSSHVGPVPISGGPEGGPDHSGKPPGTRQPGPLVGQPRVTTVGWSQKAMGVESPRHAGPAGWSRSPEAKAVGWQRPHSCSQASLVPALFQSFLYRSSSGPHTVEQVSRVNSWARCLACSAPRNSFLPSHLPPHLLFQRVLRIWDFSSENLIGNWASMF